MSVTVFFSWQSDQLENNGKNFIERALDKAIKAIATSKEAEGLEVFEPIRDIELDKDTKDEPGSPLIFETIRQKIDSCALLVSDLTAVTHRGNGELIPNPNVLVEYGYAYKTLTSKRIIQVMNIAFGKPTRSSMPFDLALHRSPIIYNLPDNATPEERAAAKDVLAKILERAIRAIIASDAYRDSLPKEPEPPRIKYREPLQGRARFRAKTTALGIYTPPFPGVIPEQKETNVFLEEGAMLWFRLAPQQPRDQPFKLSELERHAPSLSVQPIFGTTGNIRLIRGSDGWGCVLGMEGHMTSTASFLFTDGEIWSVSGFSLKYLPEYISIDERSLIKSIDICLNVLNTLGIQFPLHMVIGIEGILERCLQLPSPFKPKSPSCATDKVEKEGIINTSDEIQAMLELFFEELYDQCAIKRPAKQTGANS
jgi:hypothetical protein